MLEVTAELRVEASGCQRRQLESGAYRRTASPDLPLSLLPSAITVMPRDSHQRTDLFAIERSQLGQERYDHRGRDVADSGYTLQQLVPRPPSLRRRTESIDSGEGYTRAMGFEVLAC